MLLLPFSYLVVAATADRDYLIGDMKSLDWTAEICLLPAAAGVLTDSSPWAFDGHDYSSSVTTGYQLLN